MALLICAKSPIGHVRAPLDNFCIRCGVPLPPVCAHGRELEDNDCPDCMALVSGKSAPKYFEVHEIALGVPQRTATCNTAGEAIILAKEWHDTWGSRTVALDLDGNVIAEHAAGEPR